VSTGGSTVFGDFNYYTFAGERATINNTTQKYKFTGKELDSEDGDYHFLARDYSPRLGRWLHADRVAGNPGSPQSLNLYAYVVNSPTGNIDPAGLANCPIEKDGCGIGGSVGGGMGPWWGWGGVGGFGGGGSPSGGFGVGLCSAEFTLDDAVDWPEHAA